MFENDYPITWCPGCPNYVIKEALKKAMTELVDEGEKKENFVLVTDIGCNSKIYDYLDVSGLYGLHGRAIPAAAGVQAGKPELRVIAISGDGGAYMEGISHFTYACRHNQDMTLLVFDNQVFSLTTGQATCTTEPGFIEKTHPFGVKEKPFNPLVMALEAGASFVARGSAMDVKHLTELIKKAVKHKGFSFVDIIQPCGVYHDIREFVREGTYTIEPMNFDEAIKEAKKWDFTTKNKFSIGVLYQEERKTFEEKYVKRD